MRAAGFEPELAAVVDETEALGLLKWALGAGRPLHPRIEQRRSQVCGSDTYWV